MRTSSVTHSVKATSASLSFSVTFVTAILAAFAAYLVLFPSIASAQANNFEVTGWIPYWRAATGTIDAMPHLDTMTEVNPFVFTLKSDGTLFDNTVAGEENVWIAFNAQAKARGVRVIPTVMSGDRDRMHAVLSDTALRAKLVQEIVTLVNTQGYDGIDIDFEFKRAETKDYFSLFLAQLKLALGGSKWLMCTIETRIPLEDKYFGTTIPADAGQYSNDLKAINAACDRVRLMAYDQQNIDLKLRTEAGERLYAPVGDPAWITKVVNYMSQDLDRSKLLIGIPTYGYEYAVTPTPTGKYRFQYDILWTFNPGYALQQAQKFNVTPERAYWGEMAFSYISASAPTTSPISATPMAANTAAVAATQYVQTTNTPATFRYVVWPDAQSIKQRIDLAKSLGVRGVSIFKLDGGADPSMWSMLAGVKGTDVSTPGVPSVPSTPTGAALTRTLTLGKTGEDVRTLQKILNKDTATRIAASGAGSAGQETTKFGSMTLVAVKKFQVKYGIAKAGNAGYGIVGPATRAKLNSLR